MSSYILVLVFSICHVSELYLFVVGKVLFNSRKHSHAKITVMHKCIRITAYDGHLRIGSERS